MYQFNRARWSINSDVSPKSSVCWNCGNQIASIKGYYTNEGPKKFTFVYICPNCNAPIIYDDNGKEPLATLPGKEIKKLPEIIKNVYDEVRKCMQSNSFTGAVMLMRKIIMNIAVHEGAEKNKGFSYYVDYLCENGVVHKKSVNKAKSVKKLGNDANHEIENRTEEEAQNCFEFIELLLIQNYEQSDHGAENE